MERNIVSYLKNIKDKKLTLSQRALNYLIEFFIMMIILTFISHIADSLTIPIVNTGVARSGKLNFNVKGTGIIEADSEQYIDIEEELRVTKIFVQSGAQVKKGEPIFCFDINEVKNKCENKKTELAKLEISLNKTILEYSKQSEENSVYDEQLTNLRSEINLKEAQKQLEKANEEYDEAYITAEEKAEKEKNDNINEKKDAYEKARLDLKKVKLDNETEINNAKRAVEDAENKLKVVEDYLKDHGEDDEEEENLEYTKNDKKIAKENISRAEEDLEIARKKNDIALKDAKNALKTAEDNLEKAKKEEIDYENDIKEERDNIDTFEKDVKIAEENLEDNSSKLEKAYKKKDIDDANSTIDKLINNFNIEAARLDLVDLKKQISKLEELIKNNGQVLSNFDGTISRMDLETSKYTTGQESVSININSCTFKAEIHKDEAKKIKEGDKVVISVSSQNELIETTIESISLPDEKNMVSVTAALSKDLNLRIGEQADFTISSSSKEYNKCISIDALRSDSKGKYVLVVREKDTSLGKDLSAQRVDIELIDNSYDTIAVNGELTQDDKVIIGSDRNIEDGGRVRVEEKDNTYDNQK